jgi:hypothetical protein
LHPNSNDSVGLTVTIKRGGAIMPAIFDILYREYCRARLAEMRRQLLVNREVLEANGDAGDSTGAADPAGNVRDGGTATPHEDGPGAAKTQHDADRRKDF